MNENLRTFLEQAGRGCISGSVADWPQLKPACKWAAEEIGRLEIENRELLVARACQHGSVNAIDLTAFDEEIRDLPTDKQRMLRAAFVATFALPKDAGLEQGRLQSAIRLLAKTLFDLSVAESDTHAW